MHPRHGKMALFQHDMLGSDVDDDELVVGIEKMNHIYVDFETFNCAASKQIEKGKQKVIEVSKGKKNLNPFSNSTNANQASNGIIIRDVEGEGPTFVANFDLENSDFDFSDRDTEYVNSSDPGSDYSDNSIEDLDSFVNDDALRTASSDLYYDPNYEIPHFEVGMVFENAIQFKEAIAKYSVKKGCNRH
ncbi:hypothetical protein SLEP1_g1665 [Rubroshorea leprosula]|uniref:Uncharacterized protein n=1 Tax=Rubroshorea leprosula TaxID=152421 RepID=A0AAV5HN94_9ROSI|nr:hypothetical protein SLEP1_g1665 [Rubroshorea leprosula]